VYANKAVSERPPAEWLRKILFRWQKLVTLAVEFMTEYIGTGHNHNDAMFDETHYGPLAG